MIAGISLDDSAEVCGISHKTAFCWRHKVMESHTVPLLCRLIQPLVLNLARGFHWQELIDEGAYPNIKELAKAIGIDSGVVAKAIRLTWLSPKIIHKLIIGEADISMQTLRKSFPIVWRKQEEELL